MTPQEQLGQIKQIHENPGSFNDPDQPMEYELTLRDIDWLIARVEQLEKALEFVESGIDKEPISATHAKHVLSTGPKPEKKY